MADSDKWFETPWGVRQLPADEVRQWRGQGFDLKETAAPSDDKPAPPRQARTDTKKED